MSINPCSRLKFDSATYTGGQEKYMKYVNFSWPPVEAALSMLKFYFLLTCDWKLFFLHFDYWSVVIRNNVPNIKHP